MKIRFVRPDSDDHVAALELRYRVLRAPLGMPRGSERYAHEDDCLHAVALDDGRVIGCLAFHRNGEGQGPHTGRLLQMAVDPEAQRMGVGRRLVEALEKQVAQDGVTLVTLHARQVAFPFYQALGYVFVGAPYVEVGIPHQTMRKEW